MKYSPFFKAKYYYLTLMILFVISLPVNSQQILLDGNTQTTITNNKNISTITTQTIKNNNAFNSFKKFNVEENNTVNLILPGNIENLINIIHDETTVIEGILNSIKANKIGGHIFLVNPHGITISQNGVINTGMLTAVTPTEEFVKNFFDGPGKLNNDSVTSLLDNNVPINPNAVLTINGEIRASENVILDSDTIINTGNIGAGYNFEEEIDLNDLVNIENINNATEIQAENSNIILVASNNITSTGSIRATGNISLYANNTIELEETSSIQTHDSIVLDGKDVFINGIVEASDNKGGIIDINGLKLIIDGQILAKGSSDKGGNINILASSDCWITSTGLIDASGATGGTIKNYGFLQITTSGTYNATGSTGNGGFIDIFAPTTKILSSQINTSGYSSGGTIRLGGTYGDSVAITKGEMLFVSESLVINDNTKIIANTTGPEGDGGIIAGSTTHNIIALGNYSTLNGLNTGEGGIIEFHSMNPVSYGAITTTSRDNSSGSISLGPDYNAIKADKETNFSIITDYDHFTLWPNNDFKTDITISEENQTITVNNYDNNIFNNSYIYNYTDENYSSASLISVINEIKFNTSPPPDNFDPAGTSPNNFNAGPDPLPPPMPEGEDNGPMPPPNNTLTVLNTEYFMQSQFNQMDNPSFTPRSEMMVPNKPEMNPFNDQPTEHKNESTTDTSTIAKSESKGELSNKVKSDEKDENSMTSSIKAITDTKSINASMNLNDPEATRKVFLMCKNKGACKELENAASYRMMEQSIIPNSITKEYNADEKGTEFIIKSGYHPSGLKGYLLVLAFIEQTIQESGQIENTMDTIARHPKTADRIKKINKAISHYKIKHDTYNVINKDTYSNVMNEENIFIHNEKVKNVFESLHNVIEEKEYQNISNKKTIKGGSNFNKISNNLYTGIE